MSTALKQSLASWREAHGFSILCILSQGDEHFVLAESSLVPRLPPLSESDLRAHLAERGLSDADADEAIQLSREWATTVTGSGVLWPLARSS